MSNVRVMKNYGYFRVGEVVEVIGIIEDPRKRRKVLYLQIKGGNTIPKENTQWI